jgi:uncharacterized cupredoxin-like copper-binding protein
VIVHRRNLGVIALAGILAISLVACGDDDDSSADKTSNGGGVSVTTAAGGTAVAVELGEKSDTEYFMTAVPDSVSAGSVTFSAKNTGTKEHEMVVLKTDESADSLKVTGDKVSEDTSVGEVAETPEGKSGTLTVDLEPGNYVLVCNIAKNYARHMYTAFTVT